MSPEIVRVLYVTNVLLGAGTDEIVDRVKRDAASVGVSLVDGSVRSSEEIKAAIEKFAGESRGGIVVAFNAFTTVHRTQIVALAARHRLPAIYPLRVFTDEGGLFSYGFSQDDQLRRSWCGSSGATSADASGARRKIARRNRAPSAPASIVP